MLSAFIERLSLMHCEAMELADPRVINWPLMGSPLSVLSIVAAYIMFVGYIGPKMMKKRPPMELRKVMIIYDIFVILINVHFVQKSMRIWLSGRYHLYKEQVDYSEDPFAIQIAGDVWLYFFSKIVDMFDTVFIVLHKKSDQLSFLHTYHHAIMVVMIWYAANYIPGGSIIIVGTVNGAVHTIMYTYYLLTVLNPEVKKYVWWKRRLTEIQILQFVFLSVMGVLITIHTVSKSIQVIAVFGILQDGLFIHMFWEFYKKSYLTKKTD